MVEVKHLRHVVKPLSVLYIFIRTYRLCECRAHAHKLQRFQGHAEAQLQRFLLFLRGLKCTRQYQCTLTLSCLHFLYNHMYHQSNQLTSHFARLGAVITPPWQYCMRAPESSTATSGEAHRAINGDLWMVHPFTGHLASLSTPNEVLHSDSPLFRQLLQKPE